VRNFPVWARCSFLTFFINIATAVSLNRVLASLTLRGVFLIVEKNFLTRGKFGGTVPTLA
jgi:hypothetical protein